MNTTPLQTILNQIKELELTINNSCDLSTKELETINSALYKLAMSLDRALIESKTDIVCF